MKTRTRVNSPGREKEKGLGKIKTRESRTWLCIRDIVFHFYFVRWTLDAIDMASLHAAEKKEMEFCGNGKCKRCNLKISKKFQMQYV